MVDKMDRCDWHLGNIHEYLWSQRMNANPNLSATSRAGQEILWVETQNRHFRMFSMAYQNMACEFVHLENLRD